MDNKATPFAIEEEYAWTFFGPSAEYYLDRWRLRQQGKVVTFSVPAFFLGLFWVMYRRMYLVLAVLVMVLFLESMVEQAIWGDTTSTGATLLINLVFASLFGLFGNTMYLWYAERKMQRLVALGLPREQLLERLQQAGGTSWRPIIVVLGLIALCMGAYAWLSQYP